MRREKKLSELERLRLEKTAANLRASRPLRPMTSASPVVNLRDFSENALHCSQKSTKQTPFSPLNRRQRTCDP
jgi:hypothetical protein